MLVPVLRAASGTRNRPRGIAEPTVRTLPMAKWWDLDMYPITPPALLGA
jgi:hypothetical protein